MEDAIIPVKISHFTIQNQLDNCTTFMTWLHNSLKDLLDVVKYSGHFAFWLHTSKTKSCGSGVSCFLLLPRILSMNL